MLLAIVNRCVATSNRVDIRAWSQLNVARQASIALLIIGL